MNFLEYELKAGLGAIPDSKIQKKFKKKKRVQIEPKLEEGLNIQEGQSTLLECQLTLRGPA